MHDQEIDKAWNVWLLKKRVGFKNFDIKYFHCGNELSSAET